MAPTATIHGQTYGASLAIHLTRAIKAAPTGKVARARIYPLGVDRGENYHLHWVGTDVLYVTALGFPREQIALPFHAIGKIILVEGYDADPLIEPDVSRAQIEAAVSRHLQQTFGPADEAP